jgi:hypothetical protein
VITPVAGQYSPIYAQMLEREVALMKVYLACSETIGEGAIGACR